VPSIYLVHFALLGGQLCFGVGAVVGKIGIHGGNPVLFALVREACAGVSLCLIGRLLVGPDLALPTSARDLKLVLLAGLCVWANQLSYIIGLKLADPVSGAAWQPSQPVLTAIFAIIAGYERPSSRRALGILIATAGAMFMVLHDGSSGVAPPFGDAATILSAQSTSLQGHALFFLNCCAASCYVLTSKQLLLRYHPACVTGWAYVVASFMMLLSTILVNSNSETLQLVCTAKDELEFNSCVNGAWHVPATMVLPLVYYVLLGSLAAYLLMTWANQFAEASVVSAYTVVQPMAASALSALLLSVFGSSWAAQYGLRAPGQQDLGIAPIVLGLAIIFRESDTSSSGRCKIDSEQTGGRPLSGLQFLELINSEDNRIPAKLV